MDLGVVDQAHVEAMNGASSLMSSGNEVEDLGLEEHYGANYEARIDFNQPDSPDHMVDYAVGANHHMAQ